jgi:3-oxoacyl-[acyl-carrier protein] reductase
MTTDLFSVKDKTIIITGASRGIGKTLAEGFRDAGAIVYGTGSRPASVEWMAGSGIHGRAADMTEPGAIGAVIQEVYEKHGRLDCLINNAGIATNTPSMGFKEEDMERMIDTNFKGVFRACQAYYKLQRKSGGGVIINVSSVLGHVGTTLAAIYCGTKGAVVQMTKALAIEWAGTGFRLNALCPGFIDTDMTEMIQKRPAVLEKMLETIPMRRMGKPEDLLGAAIFLASDASVYMTGQSLIVDGGFVAT